MQDDSDYNGYHCRHCEKPLSGQRRKWCNTDCQKLGTKPERPGCHCCGNVLPAGRAKWCSDQCDPKRSRKYGTWDEFQAALAENAKNRFFCEHCGKDEIRSPSGTNRKLGYENRFCSMACRSAKADRIEMELAALHRIRKANKQKPIAKTLVKTARVCPCCKNQQLVRGQHKCNKCKTAIKTSEQAKDRRRALAKAYRLTDKGKAKRRAEKLRRKSLERGARVGEKFDPFDVFDRDGWKCQMCGADTPRRLRGSIKQKAPELDHIIPISKGGKHTMANTQCACRACNVAKGAGFKPYQTGLFTGLGL